MNTKKLIGTIIGVTAFIILIAGATFAWLTINANITNANYTGVSKQFVITYAGGSAVGSVKQISNGNATIANITSATAASDTTDAWLAVTATKAATSAKASYFKVILHGTNSLTTNSLMYAVCNGSCPSSGALAAQVTSGNTTSASCASGVAFCGIIPAGNTTDVVLVNDTTTFNRDDTNVTATYNVYFWLNMDTIDVNDLGHGFKGYIDAEARQGE